MADIGRALRLGAVPIAALVNLLSIELLYASIEPPILARMITTVVLAKADHVRHAANSSHRHTPSMTTDGLYGPTPAPPCQTVLTKCCQLMIAPGRQQLSHGAA
ncbi:MAG: hypothetical protein JO318_13790 [Chloroflexi bacterium]|nr:hypothetical protein [Chloroflexota bacterium]